MTKKIEACYVDTPFAIGVGVYAIYDFAGYNPFYILGILNSKSTTYFFNYRILGQAFSWRIFSY